MMYNIGTKNKLYITTCVALVAQSERATDF